MANLTSREPYRQSSPRPTVLLSQQPKLYWWGHPGSVLKPIGCTGRFQGSACGIPLAHPVCCTNGLVASCMAHLSPGRQLGPQGQGQSQSSAWVSSCNSPCIQHHSALGCTTGLQLDARPASPGSCWAAVVRASACGRGMMPCRPLGCSHMPLSACLSL